MRMQSCWYAICCKPRQEELAELHLRRQGFEIYLPRITCRKYRRGRWTDVIEPLFPRYVFIRIDFSQQSIAPIRSTRGVVGLVRFGGQAAALPSTVMDELIRRADLQGLHHDHRPPMEPGESVRLIGGPLLGMEGVYLEQDSQKRVILLLELLGKVNRMSVSRDWIKRAA